MNIVYQIAIVSRIVESSTVNILLYNLSCEHEEGSWKKKKINNTFLTNYLTFPTLASPPFLFNFHTATLGEDLYSQHLLNLFFFRVKPQANDSHIGNPVYGT